MPDSPSHILAQGKSLPVHERLEVIRALAESLDADESFWLNQEWAETLDRRAAEMDADSSKSVPWADVERRLAARIQQHVDG